MPKMLIKSNKIKIIFIKNNAKISPDLKNYINYILNLIL